MAKRKRSTAHEAPVTTFLPSLATDAASMHPPPLSRTRSSKITQPPPADIDTNPQVNSNIEDAQSALRASPDAEGRESKRRSGPSSRKDSKAASSTVKTPLKRSVNPSEPQSDSSTLSEPDDQYQDLADIPPVSAASKKPTKASQQNKIVDYVDPDIDGEDIADPEEMKAAMSRPPAANSSYLPLPWKGRLGYACLNTYLRQATPPVFSSRTCRIASILEHRHPLKDLSQPEHSTKNRPDKDQPPDIARGQAYVEALGLANARDIPKMLQWNDRYNIKFLRLSSEMFPFASHDVYGYKLAPFASEALTEAGRVAAELGHRLTTHPGQFTQLGSPRLEVVAASIRDLEYHSELLGLLQLPPQQDRDAVMILHMGGIFGDKAATIQRFKHNYEKLSPKIKDRLVLENDDVCYSVHDLLPVCEELNIPLVLDYHHNNIVFDSDQMREGTLDIMTLYDRIKATWTRKRITQKMHYSEPCPGAVTARQRRKHSPRVHTLPPCAPDMDLMIEAKDKEQAVFEVMRILKLPGHEKINDVVPYIRTDENKVWKPSKKKTLKKRAKQEADVTEDEDDIALQPPPLVPDVEVAMGGPENRVYWPQGFEEWLRTKKREVKPRDPEKTKTTSEKAAQRRAEKAAWQVAREASAEAAGPLNKADDQSVNSDIVTHPRVKGETPKSVYDKIEKPKAKPARVPSSKKQKVKAAVLTPSASDADDHNEDVSMPDSTDGEKRSKPKLLQLDSQNSSKRQTSRATKRKVVNYADSDGNG